jgi:pyrroline-5-carboxylate reductase
MNKILLVGCGHMGSALLKSWLSETNSSFTVIDPVQFKKINKIFNKRAIAVKSILEVKNISEFNLIIFAIKPQMAEEVLKKFTDCKFNKNCTFVSIVAGKKINFFHQYLPTTNDFIRVMPNMPALINHGMSCLVAKKNISIKNKNKINKLFSILGKTLWLKNEKDIDKVTAISGSGPGYIFLIIDAFEKAALQLGLGKKTTKKLVHQTLLGSTHLLFNESLTAQKLANKIAIKGGTTEAGLNQFKRNKILHNVFKKVVEAAYKRANQLGK